MRTRRWMLNCWLNIICSAALRSKFETKIRIKCESSRSIGKFTQPFYQIRTRFTALDSARVWDCGNSWFSSSFQILDCKIYDFFSSFCFELKTKNNCHLFVYYCFSSSIRCTERSVWPVYLYDNNNSKLMCNAIGFLWNFRDDFMVFFWRIVERQRRRRRLVVEWWWRRRRCWWKATHYRL